MYDSILPCNFFSFKAGTIKSSLKSSANGENGQIAMEMDAMSMTSSCSTASFPLQKDNEEQNTIDGDVLAMTSENDETALHVEGEYSRRGRTTHRSTHAKHRALSRLFDLSTVSKLQKGKKETQHFYTDVYSCLYFIPNM